MTAWHGERTLIGRRRNITIFLALIALCVAQSVAQFHALSHLGDRDLPGQHAPLCTDCVSHAPLLVLGAAASIVFILAVQALTLLRLGEFRAPARRKHHHAFRSRAPPR